MWIYIVIFNPIQDHLTDILEECAKLFEKAERYEVIGHIYKMAIPIYERRRHFKVMFMLMDRQS